MQIGDIASRVGETRQMNNGLNAKIIKYAGSCNVDIEFENGAVAKSVRYSNFARGKVKCPMIIDIDGDVAKVSNANINPALTFTIDSDDVHLLEGRWWCISSGGYPKSDIGYLHRVIAKAQDSQYVDHIDGDGLNNRKSNLRLCNSSENGKNTKRPSNNRSGYKGVHWHKGAKMWRAQIRADDKRIHIGYFKDKVDAAIAYNKAALIYHGNFAALNSI